MRTRCPDCRAGRCRCWPLARRRIARLRAAQVAPAPLEGAALGVTEAHRTDPAKMAGDLLDMLYHGDHVRAAAVTLGLVTS